MDRAIETLRTIFKPILERASGRLVIGVSGKDQAELAIATIFIAMEGKFFSSLANCALCISLLFNAFNRWTMPGGSSGTLENCSASCFSALFPEIDMVKRHDKYFVYGNSVYL